MVVMTMRGSVSGGVYAAHGDANISTPDARQTERRRADALHTRPLTARSDDDSGDRAAGLRSRQITPSTKK